MFILILLRVFSWLILLLSFVITIVIATSPFANQIIIPDLLLSWGYDPFSLTNHTVLWLLFGITFLAGTMLATFSQDKDKKTEILMFSGGLALGIGSLAGLLLFLNEIGILIAQAVVSLWMLFVIPYLVGLYLTYKNTKLFIEKNKRQQRERELREQEELSQLEELNQANDSDYGSEYQ